MQPCDKQGLVCQGVVEVQGNNVSGPGINVYNKVLKVQPLIICKLVPVTLCNEKVEDNLGLESSTNIIV